MGRLLSLLLLASFTVHSAPTVLLDSGEKRVRLIELYTSEGCYSCPPADKWLSELQEDSRLWHELVPVAFHVDYWDYIGWPDRFASPKYSSRQRNYQTTGSLSRVYTPGLLLDGAEWRRWFSDKRIPDNATGPGGRLTVEVQGETAETVYHAEPNSGAVTLHLAILGFGLSTEIGAGENNGKRLEHNFVVLGYENRSMALHGNTHVLSVPLPEARFPSTRTALAVWATVDDDPRPVQATGGWLSVQ